MYVRDFETSRELARRKGLKIHLGMHGSREPVESLIRDVDIPTIVATGSEDEYCTPAFFSYLSQLGNKNPWVTFRGVVSGAPHEVTPDLPEDVVDGYMKALFLEK